MKKLELAINLGTFEHDVECMLLNLTKEIKLIKQLIRDIHNRLEEKKDGKQV